MSVFIGYPSFMAYEMMKGKKGNNDGFPSIPGMIARYSASGLTNEQMAANPIIGYRINRIIDSCDITIEQIPEYEGYLVTDGVDDRVQDSSFKLNKD